MDKERAMKYALMVPFDADNSSKTKYAHKYEVHEKFRSRAAALKYQKKELWQYSFVVQIYEVFGKDGEKVKKGREHV